MHEDSVTLTLLAQPRAKKTEIIGVLGDALKVKVAAMPVEGAANEELIRFFSKFLGVPKSYLSLKQGSQSKNKVLEVRGLSGERLLELLDGISVRSP